MSSRKSARPQSPTLVWGGHRVGDCLNRALHRLGNSHPKIHPNTTLLGFRVFFGVEQLEADSLSIGRIFAGSAVALGLEAQIAAWRLRLQPGGSD